MVPFGSCSPSFTCAIVARMTTPSTVYVDRRPKAVRRKAANEEYDAETLAATLRYQRERRRGVSYGRWRGVIQPRVNVSGKHGIERMT